MGWKKKLGELKSLAAQMEEMKKEPEKSRLFYKKIVSRVEKVIVAFAKNTKWEISTNGWAYKLPNTFQVHPGAEGYEPWRCFDSQIVVKINSELDLLEITPPPVLVGNDLFQRILIPLSDFSENAFSSQLKEIYLQLLRTDGNIDALNCETDDDEINVFKMGWHYSQNREEFQMAKIAERDRSTHLYVIGATGTGKTKFLEFLIKQDIEKGNGFGVIDPHGDLIEDIKGLLVCHRYEYLNDKILDKVVLIDPTDSKFTVTFNPLEKLPNVSVAEQVGELVSSFKKIWSDSWGVRMEDLMRNSLIALGEAGLALTDLPRFLTDRNFREGVLFKVENHFARDYFIHRFNVLTDRGQLPFIEPVMNKINSFLADPRIRQIFSSNKSSFNLREIIDRKKILLIKLDKGRLKGSADLLGSLLMAKIQMAAFSRSDIPQNKRTPFYLYIDEFQSFASESFMVVLSEARKYGLSLVMAHQTLAQITEELRSLILSNAGIQVYFRVNRHDAQVLAKEAFEYSGYEVKTYKSLHPVFWSLGEEWEHRTEELQHLPPRCCYAKHKIEGGLIPLITADIEPAWEILEIEEDEYREGIENLILGGKYLVPRDSLSPAVVPPAWERTVEMHSPQKIELPIKREDAALPNVIPQVISPGLKEERQHRYLQSLIKHIAEEQGFRAVIEEPTPEGGRVDVGLEQDGRRIACEISVTSTSEQEITNIEKCLRAGYDRVILCSSEKKSLEKIKLLAQERFDQFEQEKLIFLQPEEVFTYLESEAADLAGGEESFKGYRVKVQYQSLEEEEKRVRREAVAQVILQSLKRQKG